MDRSALLRVTYRVNALATLACSVVLLGFAGELSGVFAAPAFALRAVGALFAPFAVWVWAASRRTPLLHAEALAIGVFDAVYAMISFAALAIDGAQMTAPLCTAIAVVAAPVALFAAVELSSASWLRGQAAAGTGGALTARSTRL
jgi:hypothetical protein